MPISINNSIVGFSDIEGDFGFLRYFLEAIKETFILRR